MNHREPGRNGVHAPPKPAPVRAPRPAVTRPRPRRKAGPLAWLVLAAAWLVLVWQAWQAGYDRASRSVEEHGGMTPETYRENREIGREILDGLRSGTTGAR